MGGCSSKIINMLHGIKRIQGTVKIISITRDKTQCKEVIVIVILLSDARARRDPPSASLFD